MKRIALCLCLVLGGCSGTEPVDEPPRSVTPAPSTSAPSDAAACPNGEAVAADETLRTGNPLSGDVDGDGAPESLAVSFDPAGSPGCQAFLVAESAGDLQVAALESWRSDLGLPEPSLVTLQEIDDEPGLEVVVRMGAGASTEFLGIVMVEDGALRQVSSVVPDGVGDGLFGVGGSVGHIEAVDCAPGGGVVSSFASPHGRSYRVERRFLVFDGTELVEERVEVERTSLEDIGELPEYGASPFGSCSG